MVFPMVAVVPFPTWLLSMTITEPARDYLRKMANRTGEDIVGFRFEGVVGSCRTSVPLLKPSTGCKDGETEVVVDDLRIFVPDENREMMEAATLDYDSSPLFGRGLNLTWPHGVGGCPVCGGD
jgi:Fe-S cluster assembly iron-binding protein IscA